MSKSTQLAEQGWAVVDGFLPLELVQQAFTEQQRDFAAGAFRRARVGQGEGFETNVERGDHLKWVPSVEAAATLSTPESQIVLCLEALRQELRDELRLPLRTLEFQATVYEPGAFYRKHLDTFRDGNADRLISAVLFLNPEWSEADGGVLKLYPGDGIPVDILPAPGRLALFRSDSVPHEVLAPAAQNRLAISGWFRRD